MPPPVTATHESSPTNCEHRWTVLGLYVTHDVRWSMQTIAGMQRPTVAALTSGSNHYNPTRNCNCVTQCHKNASFFYIRCTYM